MRNAALATLLALISSASAVEIRVASFNIGAHFGDTFFDYSLGDAGTPDHDTVRAILARIDADVVALQEIHSVDLQGTPNDLDDLVASLGYPHVHVPPVTGAFDTSLRVVILSRFPFITGNDIASPPGAKELSRLHPVVKVDVPGTSRDPLVISAHLKAGTGSADRFRRAVEMKRIAGYLGGAGFTNDDNYIILGDFNPSAINATFTSLPSGLPGTYVLGSDITFPISYSTNPLACFSTPGAIRLDLRQTDGSASTYDTSVPNGPTLDVILTSPAIAGRPSASEVYNSALDVSNATGLAKAGNPLASATSAIASDHYAVFADLDLDSDFPNLGLTFSSPSVTEGAPDGTVAANVTLPAIRADAVTVALVSDDPTAAAPATSTLVIPAGSLGGSVAIRTPRNFIAGGQRSVTFTATASGHDPDSKVLQVEDADGSYVFTAPGQTVVEDFSGFAGTHDPAPWTTSGGMTWQGLDDGSMTTPGLRAYGSAADSSLGFLPRGAETTATANFVNQSSVPLTSIRITVDAEQWRSAMNGTADDIRAELVTASATIPLPGLTFAASQSLPDGPVAGGAATSLAATVAGLAIPPGTSFGLRFSFNPGAGGGAPTSDVFVNEFHYDNDGTDVGEFVEIAVAPGFTGRLSDISLVLYNGDGGASYATHALDTFTGGATTASGHRLFHKLISGIQNGAPDGFAIVNSATSQVLHFISYEGVVTATSGPASGMVSTDVGVFQTSAEVAGQAAIGLTGAGGGAADFTWAKLTAVAHSPGQVNDGQTFIVPSLPSQGLAIDNLRATFLTDNDLDGLPDVSDTDDDNDGQGDAVEEAFGTDPLDSGDRFVPSVARAASPPHGLELSFPGAQGIRYTVEISTVLSAWQDLTTCVGSGRTIVVPLPVGEPRMFFRVRAGD